MELNLPIRQHALVALGPALREPPTLERAQTILDAGRALSEYPFDQTDQIHAIVASSLVFRYLDEQAPAGQQLAEALFLLSRTAVFTRLAFKVSEVASYLKRAIRAVPHSAIAEHAYARLELQTIQEYSDAEARRFPQTCATGCWICIA
jgi:hypothetical protein